MANLDFLDNLAPPPPRPRPKQRRHEPGVVPPPPLPPADPAVDAPSAPLPVDPHPAAPRRPRAPAAPPPSARESRGRAIGSFAEQSTAGGGDLYARAKAKKEAYLANLAELEYRKKSGEYVSRDAVRQATATAYAAIAQALRSIPDNLERKVGLAPEIAERVSILIDEAMGELAEDLRRIHEEHAR